MAFIPLLMEIRSLIRKSLDGTHTDM